MYVIVKEDDCRPGLPLWVSSLLHVLTEKEAREEHGLTKIYGQADVLMLVMMGTTWKVWLHVLACLFTALLAADVLMLVMMGTTWKEWLHVLACLFYCVAGS